MNNLTDHILFDFKKSPKAKDDKNGSILTTLEGYATFNDEENRNTRFYGTNKEGVSFWSRVLDGNTRVKEMLDTRTFYGSANHPAKGEDPIPSFENASHAIRNYKVDKKGVWVQLDVLNTRSGRAIKTMVDYGSKVGISTRAYGEQKKDKAGRLVPIEDQYHFVTWDLVTFPAFSKSRLEQVSDAVEIKFDVTEDSLSVSREDLEDHIKALPKEDAKVLCDYTGIDFDSTCSCSSPPASDELVAVKKENNDLKKEVSDAVEKVIELEKGAPSEADNRWDEFLKRLADNSKNDWTQVDVDVRESVLSEVQTEFNMELSDINKAYNELFAESQKSKEEHAEELLQKDNHAQNIEEGKKRLKLHIKKLESDAEVLKDNIAVLEEDKKEALKISEDVIREYEKSLEDNEVIRSKYKVLEDQLVETERLVSLNKQEPFIEDIATDDVTVERPIVAAIDPDPILDSEIVGLSRTVRRVTKTN